MLFRSGSNVMLIHSGKADEKRYADSLSVLVKAQKDLSYSAVQWTSKNDLNQRLSTTKKNVLISLYNQDKQRNMLYVSSLLNQMGGLKKNPAILFGSEDWLDYPNIDYNYLERLSFHYADNLYLDPNNYMHNQFVNEFISEYKIAPNSRFAPVGYDLIIHFVTGVSQKNEKFWEKPNVSPPDALRPTNYKRVNPTDGFENHRNFFYKIVDFKPSAVN